MVYYAYHADYCDVNGIGCCYLHSSNVFYPEDPPVYVILSQVYVALAIDSTRTVTKKFRTRSWSKATIVPLVCLVSSDPSLSNFALTS